MSNMSRKGKDCSIPVFFSISNLSPSLLSWDIVNFIPYFGLGHKIKLHILAAYGVVKIAVLCLFFSCFVQCASIPTLLISLLELEQAFFAATLKVCRNIRSEVTSVNWCQLMFLVFRVLHPKGLGVERALLWFLCLIRLLFALKLKPQLFW